MRSNRDPNIEYKSFGQSLLFLIWHRCCFWRDTAQKDRDRKRHPWCGVKILTGGLDYFYFTVLQMLSIGCHVKFDACASKFWRWLQKIWRHQPVSKAFMLVAVLELRQACNANLSDIFAISLAINMSSRNPRRHPFRLFTQAGPHQNLLTQTSFWRAGVKFNMTPNGEHQRIRSSPFLASRHILRGFHIGDDGNFFWRRRQLLLTMSKNGLDHFLMLSNWASG